MAEVTHIKEYDIDVYVCNNCGAFAESIKDIQHYTTCTPGEAKHWEKVYSDNFIQNEV